MEAVETGSGGVADAATVGELLDTATETIARGGMRGAARRRRGAGRGRARGQRRGPVARRLAARPHPRSWRRSRRRCARRAEHEPLAYVLGRAPFRDLEIHVDPRVLWPRRETELLVEVGAELPEGARVHEVGTGSGAIALALISERPDLRVTASDLSPEAAEAARENAERLGLDAGGQRRRGSARRAGGHRPGHRQPALRHRRDDLRPLAGDPARAADRRHRRLRRGRARRDPRPDRRNAERLEAGDGARHAPRAGDARDAARRDYDARLHG